MDETLYIYYHFYLSLSMYFFARHSYISSFLMTFLSCNIKHSDSANFTLTACWKCISLHITQILYYTIVVSLNSIFVPH